MLEKCSSNNNSNKHNSNKHNHNNYDNPSPLVVPTEIKIGPWYLGCGCVYGWPFNHWFGLIPYLEILSHCARSDLICVRIQNDGQSVAYASLRGWLLVLFIPLNNAGIFKGVFAIVLLKFLKAFLVPGSMKEVLTGPCLNLLPIFSVGLVVSTKKVKKIETKAKDYCTLSDSLK